MLALLSSLVLGVVGSVRALCAIAAVATVQNFPVVRAVGRARNPGNLQSGVTQAFPFADAVHFRERGFRHVHVTRADESPQPAHEESDHSVFFDARRQRLTVRGVLSMTPALLPFLLGGLPGVALCLFHFRPPWHAHAHRMTGSHIREFALSWSPCSQARQINSMFCWSLASPVRCSLVCWTFIVFLHLDYEGLFNCVSRIVEWIR